MFHVIGNKYYYYTFCPNEVVLYFWKYPFSGILSQYYNTHMTITQIYRIDTKATVNMHLNLSYFDKIRLMLCMRGTTRVISNLFVLLPVDIVHGYFLRPFPTNVTLTLSNANFNTPSSPGNVEKCSTCLCKISYMTFGRKQKNHYALMALFAGICI